MKAKEKIVIGNTDYSRKELDEGKVSTLITPWSVFLKFKEKMYDLESKGYTIKFKTSLFRMIFGPCKYKVIALK